MEPRLCNVGRVAGVLFCQIYWSQPGEKACLKMTLKAGNGGILIFAKTLGLPRKFFNLGQNILGSSFFREERSDVVLRKDPNIAS